MASFTACAPDTRPERRVVERKSQGERMERGSSERGWALYNDFSIKCPRIGLKLFKSAFNTLTYQRLSFDPVARLLFIEAYCPKCA